MKSINGIINIPTQYQRRGNIELSKFMGCYIRKDADTSRIMLYSEGGKMIQYLGYGNEKKAWGLVDFDYHTSFDHIMSVVKKIEFLEFSVDSNGRNCVITTDNPDIHNSVIINETAETRLDALWLACVKFVRWYKNDK